MVFDKSKYCRSIELKLPLNTITCCTLQHIFLFDQLGKEATVGWRQPTVASLQLGMY